MPDKYKISIIQQTVKTSVGGSSVKVQVPTQGPRGAKGEADIRVGGVLLGDPAAVSFTAGNSKAILRIPPELNGMELISLGAACSTAATSGVTTIQYRRVRAGSPDADMLSTPITIDANEIDSSTAATAAVINTTNAGVQTGDQIHFDVDTAGTGVLGVFVSFTFDTV